MKKIITLIASIAVLTSAKSQIVAGDAYIQGLHVEIGVEGNGGYEGADWNTAAPPVGGTWHYRGGNPYLGFVADQFMAGWAASNWDGDFFTPGSPENGWGITLVDGATDINLNNNRSGWPAAAEIPGAMTGYTVDGDCINVDWEGDFTSGYDLHFRINYYLNVNDLFYTTTVTITNNGSTTIPELYYHRNFDPDNNQTIGAGFTTTNTVVSQPTASSCSKAHVSATQSVPWTSYVGIAAVGPDFRATYGGFSNRDARDIWNFVGFTGTAGSVSVADEAISLAHRTLNLDPGETISFKFVIILDDAAAANAINNLFYFNYSGSLGGPPPPCVVDIDTAQACPGNPVQIDLLGSATPGFTWTWSPAAGLSTTTGTTVFASPTTSTLYTVTGTAADPMCPVVTQQIYVESFPGPDAVITDPGPQCGSFDISTLVWTDINAVAGAGSAFFTVPPGSLADTASNVFTGTIITASDSIWLGVWDPVFGCFDVEPIIIDWNGLPLTATATDASCGATDAVVTLSIPTPTGAELYSADSLTWVSSPVFTGYGPGTYTFYANDGTGGCVSSTTITVNSLPGPSITSVTSTPESCTGSCDGSITITAPAGISIFSIDNGTTTTGSGNFASICSGTFIAYIEDANGCSDTASVVVSTLNAMLFSVSPTDTVCIGETATISASVVGGVGTITYTWDNSLPNAASHTVDPSGTTVYSVYATDGVGCVSPTLTITVVENPPLNVVASVDQTICIGTSASISAIAGGGDGGPYTYTWTNNVTPAVLIGADQTVTPTAVTTYTVTVTDGCTTPSVTDVVVVDFHPTPAVDFTSDVVEGCSPLTVNFTNNTALAADCFWTFGDGSTSNSCTPMHVYVDDMSYSVGLTVTTVNGCTVDTVITNYITVHPNPVAEFTYTPIPATVLTPSVNFVNLTTDADSYSWNIADMLITNEVNPSFSFSSDSGSVYNVCLAAQNVHGCYDTVCHDVIIEEVYLIYTPNAFTPNGDGLNDIFLPYIQGESPETYELMIFNRWGEMIFLSTDELKGWDGTHKNMKAKEDVYVWKIKVKEAKNSKKHEHVGHVTLLR